MLLVSISLQSCLALIELIPEASNWLFPVGFGLSSVTQFSCIGIATLVLNAITLLGVRLSSADLFALVAGFQTGNMLLALYFNPFVGSPILVVARTLAIALSLFIIYVLNNLKEVCMPQTFLIKQAE